MPSREPSPVDDTDDAVAVRDFERRFGPRLRERPDPDGRYREPRSWLNRASDEVSAWFGHPEALRRRQRDGAVGDHRGIGPKVERRADDRILEEVGERMSDHPDLNAANIEVRVDNAEVTLRGWTAIHADIRLAEDIASSVAGV